MQGHSKHGYGALNKNNGEIYEGDFVNDKFCGEGNYFWPDGVRYEGQWQDGQKKGNGTMTYANGHSYVG